MKLFMWRVIKNYFGLELFGNIGNSFFESPLKVLMCVLKYMDIVLNVSFDHIISGLDC